jgi:ABC-type dipeptide/oligopeptide/nickel transport system permease component
MFLTLCLVMMITYLLMFFAPGGPYDSMRQNHVALTFPGFLSGVLSAMSATFTLTPNLGGVTRGELLGACLTTWFLTFGSILVAGLFGVPAGILAALRPHSLIGRGVAAFSVLISQVPPFNMAAILLIAFSLNLRLFPPLGWGRPEDAVLPVLSLACVNVGYVTKFMQSGMKEVMRNGFIVSVRARGIPEAAVVLRHALRPAMVSLLTFFGPQGAMTVFYSLIIEGVYGIPGMGRILDLSVNNLGFINLGMTSLPLAVMMFSVIGFYVMALNLIVDLAYRWLQPGSARRTM